MANFSLLAKLGVDTKGFQEGLGKAKGSVGKFKGALGSLGGVIASVGLTSMAREAINLGSKISDMAVQLQISSDALQVLEFSARKAGVETGIMERAIRNVQLRTQQGIEGNKRYAEAYQTLGLSIEEVNRLSPEKKLEAIARASQMATDKQAAYNAVAAILGERAGPKMQEVLQDLAKNGYGALEEAAKKSGEVMDKDTIAKMDAAADKIESFKRQVTVLTGEILTKIVPAFMILKEVLGFVGEVFGVNILNAKAFFTLLISNVKTAISPVIKQFEALSFAVKAAFAIDPRESSAYIKAAAQKSKEGMQDLINAPKEIANNFKTAAKDVAFNVGSLKGDFSKRAGEIKSQWTSMFEELETSSTKFKNSFGGGNNAERNLKELKKKTLEIQRELARAQADGDREREQALQRQLEIAKKVAELMGMGFGAEEAGDIAKSLASTKGDFVKDLKPKDLVKAANEAAKEDGRRFQRLADGTFQEFINGSKGKIVTEEQLKKAVEAKIESKPTEKLLEQIKMVLEGKFVNE